MLIVRCHIRSTLKHHSISWLKQSFLRTSCYCVMLHKQVFSKYSIAIPTNLKFRRISWKLMYEMYFQFFIDNLCLKYTKLYEVLTLQSHKINWWSIYNTCGVYEVRDCMLELTLKKDRLRYKEPSLTLDGLHFVALFRSRLINVSDTYSLANLF